MSDLTRGGDVIFPPCVGWRPSRSLVLLTLFAPVIFAACSDVFTSAFLEN